MDMRETQEMADFRREVRDWVKANMQKEKADPYNYVGLGDRAGQDDWFAKPLRSVGSRFAGLEA